MWAADASGSFLLEPASAARALIESRGFAARAWEVTTSQPPQTSATPGGTPIQTLVMGDRLPAIMAANQRNWAERRLASIQAVFEPARASTGSGLD
jgi:hypothetical protein